MFVEAVWTLQLPLSCKHVLAGQGHNEILASAALILLSGGDTQLGWETMVGSGMDSALRSAAAAGAVLVMWT